MSQIDNIVNVSISRQTTQVEMTAFDIPLILVDMTTQDENSFSDRVRTYTSLEAVEADLPPTHKGYIMASKLLGGDIKPATFKIGKKKTTETYVEALQAVIDFDDTWYALLADSHEDADIDALAGTIQGMRKLYFTSTSSQEAFEQNQAVTYTTEVQFSDLDLAATGDKLTIRVSGKNYSTTATGVAGSATWGAMVAEDGGTLSFTATVTGNVLKVENTDTAFVITKATQTIADTSAYSGDVDASAIGLNDPIGMDIGQRLKAKSMFRTIVVWSATADSEYPEAAWVGTQIVETPGSNTWEYKKLVGVTVSRLTDSQISILESRNFNYYIPVKGVNIIRRGVSADKEWVDVLVLVDWLYARLQEQIFYRLVNTRKISYTDQGFTIIENEIRSVFAQAIANGGIDTYTLNIPKVLSIPENVRAQRKLETITFDARLQGAVSTVRIVGQVHP